MSVMTKSMAAMTINDYIIAGEIEGDSPHRLPPPNLPEDLVMGAGSAPDTNTYVA